MYLYISATLKGFRHPLSIFNLQFKLTNLISYFQIKQHVIQQFFISLRKEKQLSK